MMDAADHILALRGAVTMSALAQGFGLGLRHFERRFTSAIGYPPKLHARIARFQTALDWKVRFPRKTWREIAHALHYHDQMHMIHDFEKLGGAAPTQVFIEARDQRPPALIIEVE
jgi:transcriptional regulator GlxA family with amidase domain